MLLLFCMMDAGDLSICNDACRSVSKGFTARGPGALHSSRQKLWQRLIPIMLPDGADEEGRTVRALRLPQEVSWQPDNEVIDDHAEPEQLLNKRG